MTNQNPTQPDQISSTGFDRMNLTYILASEPEPQRMAIPNVLPAGEVGLLVGEPGTSKTQLALTMGIALATGQPFMGLAIPEVCPVAYFAMEGSRRSFEERLRRMPTLLTTESDFDVNALIATNLQIIHRSGHPSSMASEPMAKISDHVERMVEDGVVPGLIIIDTLTCVAIGDENSAEAARPIWDYANYIREITGGTVMFIHHLGKPGNKQGQAPRSALHAIRGTSAHHAAARFILGLTVKKKARTSSGQRWSPGGAQSDHGDLLELKVLANNDGQEGQTMLFERDTKTGLLSLHEVPGTEADQGDPSPTLVKLTKDQQVLSLYRDPAVDEADRETLALSLFNTAKDPRSALRSALKRLRDSQFLP